MHRVSLVALASALVLFGLSLAASLLLHDKSVQPVKALKATQDQRALRALMTDLKARNATNCVPFTQTADASSRYTARVLSVASASCDTLGSGPDSIVGLHFRNLTDLRSWEYDNRSFVAVTDNMRACGVGSPPFGWWSRGGSTLDGRIYCEPSASKGGGVAWSERSDLNGFYVSSTSASIDTLLAWWRRYVQRRPTPDPGGLQAIRRAFRGYVAGSGLDGCRETSGPLPDAALICDRVTAAHPGAGSVDHLSAFHFQSAKALTTFFADYKDAYRAPDDTSITGFCRSRALYAGTYDSGDNKDVGSVFCYPDEGVQDVLYTIDAQDLAILLGRDDGSVNGVFQVFKWFPG
jgi:hypothetical protein